MTNFFLCMLLCKVCLLTAVWSRDKVCVHLHPEVDPPTPIQSSKGQLLTPDPFKFQVRLEVLSSHPQQLHAQHVSDRVDLCIMATGSVQGVKPLTRHLSCCLFVFLFPADKCGRLSKTQTRKSKSNQLHFLLLNPQPYLCINKHVYRRSTHLSSPPSPT